MTTEERERQGIKSAESFRDNNNDDRGNQSGHSTVSSGKMVRTGQSEIVKESSRQEAATVVVPTENLVGMASIEEVLAWLDNFAKLKSRVIMQNPAYYTRLTIRAKERVLINRSGWRAIQLAFNINDDIVKEETVMHPDEKNYTVRIWVRAWHAKSGRQVIGVGSCSTDEPGKVFQHPHHDVYATAHTRAKNRAISDIVGAGEVSAEEIGSPYSSSASSALSAAGTTAFSPKNEAERAAWEKAKSLGKR
jgi:hypothetical protein